MTQTVTSTMSKPCLSIVLQDPDGWLSLLAFVVLYFKDREKYAKTDRILETKECRTFGIINKIRAVKSSVRLHLFLCKDGIIRLSFYTWVNQGIHLGSIYYLKRTNIFRFEGWFFHLLRDELEEMFMQLKEQMIIVSEA